MKQSRHPLYYLIMGIYLGVALCAGFLQSCTEPPLVITTYYDSDRAMWDHITKEPQGYGIREIPAGAILPHHAMTAIEVARFYKGLTEVANPDRFVIFCPNHFEYGSEPLITADNIRFDTEYGDLDVDSQFIKRIASAGLVAVQNEAFPAEHGIHFHSTFIRKYFPRATIVPVLSAWLSDKEENDRLTEYLISSTDENTFFIASVDFSHYNPKAVADFHDETSITAIHNFDYEKLYDLEVDSPSSLYMLLKTMGARGYCRPRVFNHTNSDSFIGHGQSHTTSHFYIGFFEGFVERSSRTTVLIMPPGLYDGSPVLTDWDWNRDMDNRDQNDALQRLRGQEDRFFMGTNVYLLDTAGISQRDIELPNSKIRIFIHRAGEDSLVLRRELGKMQKPGTFSLVYFLANETVSISEEIVLMKAVMDMGADCAISQFGTQTIYEEYSSKILYNFPDHPDGWEHASHTKILGLVFDDSGTAAYEFPIILEDGIPAYDYSGLERVEM